MPVAGADFPIVMSIQELLDLAFADVVIAVAAVGGDVGDEVGPGSDGEADFGGVGRDAVAAVAFG